MPFPHVSLKQVVTVACADAPGYRKLRDNPFLPLPSTSGSFWEKGVNAGADTFYEMLPTTRTHNPHTRVRAWTACGDATHTDTGDVNKRTQTHICTHEVTPLRVFPSAC